MATIEESRPWAFETKKLRVDSCLNLIHDVSALLTREGAPARVVKQLERLDEMLKLIDHNAVTDHDLERIEGSTNQLMNELGALFSHQDIGAVYPVNFH